MNPKYFRKGTPRVKPFNAAFIFNGGGIGDYINWVPAIEWIVNENPHVNPFVIVSQPIRDVLNHHFRKEISEKRLTVLEFDENKIEKALPNETHIHFPEPGKQYANATGFHLMDIGFTYFCNFNEAPQGYNRMPTIDFGDGVNHHSPWLWPELEGGRFAVLTPGATALNRQMPAKAFNELVEYIRGLGITPVFLGREHFVDFKQHSFHKAKFNEGYDYSKGVNLLEKTSLLETVQIMRKAEFVLGLDNGLLHMASTTEVPIIFGLTITSVKHRNVRRTKGLTIHIHLTEKDLACTACQSRTRFLAGHAYKHCIYTDNLCCELIFANNSATWKAAIDHILKMKNQ